MATAKQTVLPEISRVNVEIDSEIFTLFKLHCIKKKITMKEMIKQLIVAELSGSNKK